eukprot:gnl/MRDRNA2_/MRDRNA2_87882_c0_seq1.p1 gnl/MRDRNA2_/MRDRNA2_87882_c0~~gnl/MRDRNA2_/MRDRNA2_87882_c0_seq1.p1  ORF type:complete len:584 (+),score=168.77 gnl/MRDRNA2_/MRDRNA2_87882_c0_seq1:155-1906(+)
MSYLVPLSLLGICISQVALAASKHHHGHQHFRDAKHLPQIVEMPTHSWGHVTQPAKAHEEAVVVGLHSSQHHNGFQHALEHAEKEVQEKEKELRQGREQESVQAKEDRVQLSKHRLGFQRALENAERKVLEGEEKALASEHHKKSQHGSSKHGTHADKKTSHALRHHKGFQRALENVEKHVLEREKRHEARKAREAETEKAVDDEAITIRTKEAEEEANAAERLREEEKARKEEEIRQKELAEADAEGERLELQNARRLISKRENKRGGPFDAFKKGFEDATKNVKKGMENLKKTMKDAYDATGKPLMNPINTMRAELCIRRKPLLTHKPCMKFMVKECTERSSGKGYCKKFFHMVLDACYRAQEQGEDPEGFCELSEKMGSKRDVDEDGVPDITDRFPADRTEWSDMDNDGIGDNTDPDRDGDGFLNENDPFPDDAERPPSEKGDMDGDGIPDDEDPDKDGDGYDNETDAYPEDPTRWLADSPYPSPAPAPAAEIVEPAMAPAAPAAAPGMTKEIVGLPEQGYGEYYRGNLVKYADGENYGDDWRSEWPLMDETHEESVLKACENHPKSGWCMRFKAQHGLR